ncbi:phosphate ABC transporter ATP-binding protein (PhoT family) [Ureibacillus xyleni]|uniref:Phosphate ABC transporter ATP-binding protein (PhoT family) n=1 Tax=Ureibacillus xyleni TaxID=614648 RepID=A0A285RW29_9BACL|nr:phosphate ABC transporter ATP-binding protein [Ureibacillus xyleni]SOB98740.1 phosphate ABC transporter ATP-binding protein (PhoT family) [Ureibacillus xyleni]
MTQFHETVIKFENVCYETEQLSILNNVSGEFYKGKITTLVGPSGAGKTTLLKLCNGLYSPTSGEVYIQNKPINSYEPTTLRRNVGIVLQSAPILKGTVYENLALPYTLQNKKFPKTEAIKFLNNVGLDESFLHRHAEDLSGGQRQKVSIARTFINHPEVLLLDEITSALDPSSVNDIEQLILKINQKYQVTMIWITHNIEQAKRVGDYTWVMMNGQLLESGETNILWNNSNKYIQNFVSGVQEV